MNQAVILPTGEEAWGELRFYMIDAVLPLAGSPVICVPVASPEFAALAYVNRFGREGAIAMVEFVPKSGPRRYFSWVEGDGGVE